MKLYTENLQGCSKLYNQIRKKNIPVFEFVRFDPVQGKIYFQTDVFKGFFPIKTEGEHKPFLVRGGQFFQLIEEYDYLIIEDTVFYSPEGNKFQIPTMSEEELPISEKNHESETRFSFGLDIDISQKIKTASQFADLDENSPHSYVFLKEKGIVGITSSKAFVAYLDNVEEELFQTSFAIPQKLIKILMNLVGEDVTFVIQKDDTGSGSIGVESDILHIETPISELGELPLNVFSEEFRESYIHDSFVKINSEKLKNSVSFILSLLTDGINFRTKVEILPECLQFYVEHDSKIQYAVPIEEVSNELINTSFYVNTHSLSSALQAVCKKEDQNIMIRYKEDSPTIYVSGENERLFVIQALLENP